MIKKAILVVSVGTTYSDTRKLTIDRIEERASEKFKDYEIRRAFTSHRIINVLKERDGIKVDTPEEAFEKLINEGFSEVIVQPLHLTIGKEYEYIKKVVERYKSFFQNLKLGRPILYFRGGVAELPDDYEIFVEAIKEIIPPEGLTIFMGHGSIHTENEWYSYLLLILHNKCYKNVYIANLKGYPTLDIVVSKIDKEWRGEKKVTLIPLMLVAGEHAKNDMAGEKQDSWKNVLLKKGFKVNLCLHGLGEIYKFQNIYLNHITDAIEKDF